MYQKNIPDVLRIANEIEDPEQRAKFLNENMRDSLVKVLASIHNPEIEFDKFKGISYSTKYNKAGISDSSLDHEMKRLYIFEKTNATKYERKRQRLIQILESLYDEEAKLLYESIICKYNPYKNINKNFIKKYFPFILTTKIERK